MHKRFLFAALISVISSHAANATPNSTDKREHLSEAQLWALACPALLDEVNNYNHNELPTQAMTPENIQKQKDALEQFWTVTNRSDLLENLKWIEKSGHRHRFDALAQALATKDKTKIDQLKSSNMNAEDVFDKQVEIEHSCSSKVGKKSIIAYDYCSYIDLCRWGYAAGYLTEQEAWEKIMPAAKVLQKTFSSWADMANDYLIGRDFCSINKSEESDAAFKSTYTRLLREADSPWVKLPWNVSLASK